MEKTEYVMPDFEIVRYAEFDVIATSGTEVTGGVDEGEDEVDSFSFGEDY
ncbi:MAG: hypothetical protein PUB34_06620 [Clostridia bacterium]|nr:hypothetical protein [Clostridia bacterium]